MKNKWWENIKTSSGLNEIRTTILYPATTCTNYQEKANSITTNRPFLGKFEVRHLPHLAT